MKRRRDRRKGTESALPSVDENPSSSSSSSPDESNLNTFELKLTDFSEADLNANGKPSDVTYEDLFLATLFDLSPVSGQSHGPAKSANLVLSSNCFATLSHSFIAATDSDADSSDDKDHKIG